MSGTFQQNIDYWIHKTKAFLHDPPDKAIHIPGHEERANRIIAALGLAGSTLSKEEYGEADRIASGMDRACLPGYVQGDDTKNGAIEFLEHPRITHPTGDVGGLKIKLPLSARDGIGAVDSICREIEELVKRDIGTTTDGKGLSEKEGYRGNEENFAPARFHYLYFLLRRRLAQENVGGLGELWHRLPADTRLPDHSIWQHNGLVSALSSCRKFSDHNRASLMVYALTPVQDFIGRARKLRDYWSGSVLLSWLVFEGIKAVIYHFGADHIVYPSLHGQPLMEGLLRQWHMEDAWLDHDLKKAKIASFPNKFVCLVPMGKEKYAAGVIEAAISSAWQCLGDATLALIEKKIPPDGYIKRQFSCQLGSYWEHHWAAVPLVRGEDRKIVKGLLHKDSIEAVFEFWKQSQEFYNSSGEGQLYSVSHRLAQAMLAAGKTHRQNRRLEEKGIKCDMFGEFEILHYESECGKNPKPSEDPFWKDMRRAFGETEFGATERLCSLAMVKRLAYRVCRDIPDHPLQVMFKKSDTFPSTTEMAMTDWWRNLNRKAKDQDRPDRAKKIAEALSVLGPDKDYNNQEKIRQKLAQWYHEFNGPESVKRQGRQITEIEEKERSAARDIIKKLHPVQDIHKYYAVLMMDGDRMGRLVNGETLAATWEKVLHPILAERFKENFDPKFKKFWGKWLVKKRLVSPAVHAAISEALGDFALHTVPAVIEKKYGGRLIYAGGDDVCAVLPAGSALDAAREIAAAYRLGFVTVEPNQAATLCNSWNNKIPGKLAVHLGFGPDISISAGIMIAHHKKPLGKVMAQVHELLETAKKKGGRNGFALELDKRSGGGRVFIARWDEEKNDLALVDHFSACADALRSSRQTTLSSSLAYRLNTFTDGLTALAEKAPEQIEAFIAKQLDRSGLNRNLSDEERKKELARVAGHVAALVARPDEEGNLPVETLIIANFIGHCRQEGLAAASDESRGAI